MKFSLIGVLSHTEFESSLHFLKLGASLEKKCWKDAEIA